MIITNLVRALKICLAVKTKDAAKASFKEEHEEKQPNKQKREKRERKKLSTPSTSLGGEDLNIRYHVTANKDRIIKEGFKKGQSGGVGGGTGQIYVWSNIETATSLRDHLNLLEQIRVSDDPIQYAIKHSKSGEFGSRASLEAIESAKSLFRKTGRDFDDRTIALYASSHYVPFKSFNFDGPLRKFEVVKIRVLPGAKPDYVNDSEERYDPSSLEVEKKTTMAKALKRLVANAQGECRNLDDAIEIFKKTESEGVGYRKMTPSNEKEVRKEFEGVWKKPIFRALRTDKVDKNNLGIFWSFSRETIPHWGDPDKPVKMLVAKVEEDDIDWEETIEQHMKPQYCESEIRLKETAKPKLLAVFESLEDFWDSKYYVRD